MSSVEPMKLPQSAGFAESPEYMNLSAALAMEIASGLSKPSEIFSRHGYSPEDAARMLQNPAFQSMLREAKSTWNSDANAEERIRMKARLALEEILPSHYVLAVSPGTPPATRNEVVKTFERLSGMAATRENGGGSATGERFIVNINLGEAKPTVTIDAPVLAEED